MTNRPETDKQHKAHPLDAGKADDDAPNPANPAPHPAPNPAPHPATHPATPTPNTASHPAENPVNDTDNAAESTSPDLPQSRSAVRLRLRELISELPATPGVYLFKDDRGRVLYVGKAKTLRSRVASYFQDSARLSETRGPEIDRMVNKLVCDIEVIPLESEVDALLHEARLIKDIRPKFNIRMKDDKSFPYLMITRGDDFPGVYVTRQPLSRGVRLFGPFIHSHGLRAAMPLLQRAFKFRTCTLEIKRKDESRRFFRPCILHSIKQCSAPCADKISQSNYRASIAQLIRFLNSRGSSVLKKIRADMKEASAKLEFERAAELRDQLKAFENLASRGLAADNLQPEVFAAPVEDPRAAMAKLADQLGISTDLRSIEGIDIAHLAGGETVGSVVSFVDGRPFKSGYRRFKIRSHSGNDDYASIAEVVSRRYRKAATGEELFPDVVLIDGGKGQLAAALAAFAETPKRPAVILSLAKKDELIFRTDYNEPLKLRRNDPALKVLQYVRDEAHRFAQHYHHILRKKTTLD